MKILSIQIHNLASLEGHAVIDFTIDPLASAGIFAITGPTGAGKSTILDALCLALYGKTPRYLQAKELGIEVSDVKGSTINQGDVRGILRDGTAEGYAKVAFVGADGQKYLASWSVRRARQRAEGTIQADSMQLEHLETGRVIASKKREAQEAIEQAIGLNFDQFTRSVLLAQGDFSAFLKASKDEKSSLLEKLTGTQVYSEISMLTFEKYKEARDQVAVLEQQAEGVERLSDEDIALMKDEHELAQEMVKNQHIALEQYQKGIEWFLQLDKLKVNVRAAISVEAEAIADNDAASERRKKLVLLEEVQNIRPQMDALQSKRVEKADKEKDAARLHNINDQLNAESASVSEALTEAKSAQEMALQKVQDTAPLLEQASKLDTQLEQAEKELRLASQELNEAKKQHAEIDDQLHVALQNKAVAEQTISQLHDWQAQNAARQPIAENQPLITSKLSDAETYWTGYREVSEKLEKVSEDIRQKESLTKRLAVDLKEKDVQVSQKQKAWEALQRSLEAVSISELEKELNDRQQRKELVQTAQNHWRELHGAVQLCESIKSKLQSEDQLLTDLQKELENSEKELETLRIRRQTSQQMLDRARLESAKNVEDLRGLLNPEEPCPVCGSAHHPYATNHPQVEGVLKGLEQSHQGNEQHYLDELQRKTGLEKELKQGERSLEDAQKSLEKSEEARQQLLQSWEHSGMYEEVEGISETDLAEWLEEEMKQEETRRFSLKQQLDSQRELVKNAEQQKTDYERSREHCRVLEDRLKEVNFELKSLQEGSKRDLQDFERYQQQLAAVEKKLNPYFEHGEWFEGWKKDPDHFVAQIRDFTRKWQQKATDLEQEKEVLRKASGEAEVLKTRKDHAATQLAKATGKSMEATAIHDKWKSERSQLLDGRPVLEVKSELEYAGKASNERVEVLQQEQQSLNEKLVGGVNRLDQLNQDLKKLSEGLAELSEQVESWRLDYNKQHDEALTKDMLSLLLQTSHEQIQNERKHLQELADVVTQAKATHQERTEQLQKHESGRKDSSSKEELEFKASETKEELEAKQRRIHEIAFKLEEDQKNKKRYGGLLQRIESERMVSEEWGRLSELIGSADGKKFRQVAQEYTLDVLISYANVHLRNLTPRYHIERIPDTLGLQVLDHDMGDEYRTVYSLSGGESFLVSLALALGLASISSSRMKVESLFIDEGFGSLDPATLHIAMDALDRLHNQGRKVGVISHVEEMKERIPVQIKVMRLTNGKSSVHVY